MYTWDPAYPLLAFLMKEFTGNGRSENEQFFGYRLSSARMVIECAFGRVKARFVCLKREIDINIDDLPYVIHSCFILHNFCELRKESVPDAEVESSINYDRQFQPPNNSGYAVNNNETLGKALRKVFVK